MSSQGTIILSVVGMRSNDGQVKIALFNSPDGFPDKSEKAIKRQVAAIENNTCQTILAGLEYGDYAFGVIHDENGNGDLDTGIFGIPKEGYGASNNAKGFMGPPKFKDAKFVLNSDTLHIEIKMNY
jgi:uncharacterized protein (DUF2141 family)